MLQKHNMTSLFRSLSICLLASMTAVGNPAFGQSGPTAPPVAQHSERPAPPIRDPHTPGYVAAKELPDGAIPPANVDGNFIIGPTYVVPAGVVPADEGVRG